jgi:DNA-binding protein WhiA
MSLLVTVENAAVARMIFSLVKDRYGSEMELFVKKKMNLNKNRIYGIRILTFAREILEDVGLYTARGLREKPVSKIVQTDSNARAFLTGAFLASGSINPPEKPNYHLEITAGNEEYGLFLIEQMARFNIPAKKIERRGKTVVYVKAAEKIGDFLRCIEAHNALMKFEDERIERDFTNNFIRLNNIDVANEQKIQKAAEEQIDDIKVLLSSRYQSQISDSLKQLAQVRLKYPDAALSELTKLYEQETGESVSKSGLRHRFLRIRELAEKERLRRKEPEE